MCIKKFIRIHIERKSNAVPFNSFKVNEGTQKTAQAKKINYMDNTW